MSRSKFRVLVDNHTHAGRNLKKDEVIELREDVGKRYPAVFAPVADTGGKAGRAAATPSNEE